jgi:hypothetical protein
VREKMPFIVNRSLVFVGAVALAAAQTGVSLGASPGGSAPSRPAAPAPHAAVRGVSANHDDFKMPFDVDVRPKPLLEPRHFAPLPLYPWYGSQSRTAYPWLPVLYGPACYANNNFLSSPSEQQPPDFTIGSLVDGKSNLLSSPSYNAGFTAANDPAAASSSPLTLQAAFYPTTCGAPGFTSF